MTITKLKDKKMKLITLLKNSSTKEGIYLYPPDKPTYIIEINEKGSHGAYIANYQGSASFNPTATSSTPLSDLEKAKLAPPFEKAWFLACQKAGRFVPKNEVQSLIFIETKKGPVQVAERLIDKVELLGGVEAVINLLKDEELLTIVGPPVEGFTTVKDLKKLAKKVENDAWVADVYPTGPAWTGD